MYERFTDRARKVCQLANQEAQRYNHEYIGTEHMLIAMLKEGTGVAANVLKNLDVDLRKLRDQLVAGQDIVTLGKLPMVPSAKNMIDASIQAALDLGHNYVGTEHMLFGLVADPDSAGCMFLKNIGITPEMVREELRLLLGTFKKETGTTMSDAVDMEKYPVVCTDSFQQNQKTRVLTWDCIGGDQVEKIIFNGRVFVPEVSDNPAVVEKNDN